MAVNQLTTPGKIVGAIERHGVMRMNMPAPGKAALAQQENELVDTLARQGVAEPRALIDRVQSEIAKRGDADGLYEDTDRARALVLLKRESGGGMER